MTIIIIIIMIIILLLLSLLSQSLVIDVLFVRKLGANHATGASVTQRIIISIIIIIIIIIDPSLI